MCARSECVYAHPDKHANGGFACLYMVQTGENRNCSVEDCDKYTTAKEAVKAPKKGGTKIKNLLTKEQIAEVRALKGSASMDEVAARYGISPKTVSYHWYTSKAAKKEKSAPVESVAAAETTETEKIHTVQKTGIDTSLSQNCEKVKPKNKKLPEFVRNSVSDQIEFLQERERIMLEEMAEQAEKLKAIQKEIAELSAFMEGFEIE